MSDTMPRRRKINTRVGRLAARERVRQLVSAHDDQVVLLIWGGRVLDSLRGEAGPGRWKEKAKARDLRS